MLVTSNISSFKPQCDLLLGTFTSWDGLGYIIHHILVMICIVEFSLHEPHVGVFVGWFGLGSPLILSEPTHSDWKITEPPSTDFLFEIDRVNGLRLAVGSVEFENLLEKENGEKNMRKMEFKLHNKQILDSRIGLCERE